MQRVDKREAIVATAETLFTLHGARRVTVEELCRVAGVSKMTFYKHFRDKTDLVRHLHDELVDRGFATFDEISLRDIPFPEKIEAMGRWKQEFMSRLNVGFFEEMLDIKHTMDEYRHRYLANIRRAQEAGEIRTDISPEFVWIFVERAGELMRDASLQDVCTDLGDAQRQLRTLLWYGLLCRGSAPSQASDVKGGM